MHAEKLTSLSGPSPLHIADGESDGEPQYSVNKDLGRTWDDTAIDSMPCQDAVSDSGLSRKSRRKGHISMIVGLHGQHITAQNHGRRLRYLSKLKPVGCVLTMWDRMGRLSI